MWRRAARESVLARPLASPQPRSEPVGPRPLGPDPPREQEIIALHEARPRRPDADEQRLVDDNARPWTCSLPSIGFAVPRRASVVCALST